MLIQKNEMIADLQIAIQNKKGFAMGKLGFSEQFCLSYLPLIRSHANERKIRAYETGFRYICEKQFGVFPTDADFLKIFANWFVKGTRQLDILGLFGAQREKYLIKEHLVKAKLIDYRLTEPDQSIPENPANCYLPLFKNKKILLIASFADLLKSRATKETFEAVWENIGKKWFEPQKVSSLEFPYAYITEAKTYAQFKTVLDLYEYICEKINTQDFDIALVAAGSLGIPIAAYIKSLGKVGISLGGHLQVIFGISGKRWENDPHYQQNFLNENWIKMPLIYHPENKDSLTDSGAYW